MGLLNSIRRKIYSRTSRHLSNAMLVEGTLKDSDLRFKSLLIDNSTFTEYIISRTYAEPPVVLKKWKILNSSVKKVIAGVSNSVDTCIAVLPVEYESSLNGVYSFKCQEYVRQVIEIDRPWENIIGDFNRERRRSIKTIFPKNGLSFRVSSDEKDLKLFYYDMFLPHIKKHGKLAEIDTYEDMADFFRDGLLLFVTMNRKDVAGGLSLIKDGILTFRRMGVLNGDDEYISCGAQSALYYYHIFYAKEMNLTMVDTMKSRPFLNDGVFWTKKSWGAKVLPDDESRSWVYFFNTGPDEKIAHFFEKNPAIAYSDNGLKGVIGISNGTEISTVSVHDLTHRYLSNGIKSFTILTPQGEITDGIGLNDSQIN